MSMVPSLSIPRCIGIAAAAVLLLHGLSGSAWAQTHFLEGSWNLVPSVASSVRILRVQ